MMEFDEKNFKEAQVSGQLMRIDDVAKMTTLAKSTIHLWITQQKFPPPITLSATIKVWKYQDILNWIDERS